MNKLSIATIALTASLAFAPHVHATFSLIDNGDFTTDRNSGLDWLDVTLTTNRSFIDVSGQFGTGGDFAGYRYASVIEFNDLVANVTGGVSRGRSMSPRWVTRTAITGLQELLGVTQGSDPGEVLMTDTTGFVYQPDVSLEPPVAMILSFSGRALVGFSGAISPSVPSSVVGSFLVRETFNPSAVPEPATAFMFAPALLLCLGLRRRAKQA